MVALVDSRRKDDARATLGDARMPWRVTLAAQLRSRVLRGFGFEQRTITNHQTGVTL
jgi:hypothetical protein